MAAIGKIRQHGGFLTVVIGIALASFVIGPEFMDILFKTGPEFDNTSIAVINEQKVDIDYFNQKVEEQIENYKQNQKKENLTSEERYSVTMQVWDLVKKETLLNQEELKLGLARIDEATQRPAISRAEYTDMIIGDHPHQFIVQNFSDQTTGQFNPQYVKNFLTNVEQGLASEDPEQRQQAEASNNQWRMISNYIKDDRLTQKYNTLIKKGYYIPTALAEMEYNDRNTSHKIRYSAVRYAEVTDEEAVPSDADYQAYYDEHINEYEQKSETRKIDYLVWNVVPSAEDIVALEKQVNEITTEFATIDNDNLPVYVNSYRDSRYDSSWFKTGQVSPFIDSLSFNSENGTIMGPWQENNAYHIARLVDTQMRPDSMKASHILISYSGAYGASEDITRTKIGAKILADSLLTAAVNNTNVFDTLASRFSDDPSAKTNAGDLDWFADGEMVYEFNQACIQNNVDDVKIVETAYGYHVLKITGKKEDEKKVRIAKITIPISYSKETHNLAFTEATRFASMVNNMESFDSISTNQQLSVMKGDFMNEMDANVTGIPDSRSIVRWTFEKETVKESISDVFDYDNRIIVAIVSDIRPKGISSLDEVKEFISPLVIRDVKARILTERVSNSSDINSFANSNGTKVDTADYLTFSTYSLPKYGPEPNIQGSIFAAQDGAFVGPLKGDQGVFYFIVDGITPAPENTANYKFTKEQVRSTFVQSVDQAAFNALDEAAEIQDFRKYVY